MCGPRRWLAPSTPATPTSSLRSWTVSWSGHDSGPRGGALGPPPVALVVPHAGYVYSGSVAASAYDLLRDRPVRRVAVLGPAHYVAFAGIAVPAVAAFATPIGEVPVEVNTCAALAERYECVIIDDRPHRPEHSIEVQLPFLQRVLVPGWTCVPLVVGATAPEQVADVLDALCIDGDVLPVVSTDLSHYLDLPTAQRRDRRTAQAVVDRDAAGIGPHDACGAYPPTRSAPLGAQARARRAAAATGDLCRLWRRCAASGRLCRVRGPALDRVPAHRDA